MVTAVTKYSLVYVATEQQARNARRGLWNGDAEAPWTYRERRWVAEQRGSPNGCPIKGNVTRKGERIYHAPAKTTVNEREGERWFRTEEEASRSGWRAPYWR
jgi:hypothetical protein